MKLDKLDKKILYMLDGDGRTPYKKIAKELRSSPEVIRYRLKRLENLKIIKRFMLLINFSELGYVGHGVFCRFKSEKNKEKYLNYLRSHKSIYWIAEFGGKYDLAFAIMAKNSLEFYKILNNIKDKTSEFIEEFDVAIRIQLIQFPRSHLIEEKRKPEPYFYFGKEINHQKIDKMDLSILKELSQNSREEIVEISNKLKIPASTIAFRIKKLKEKKIIHGFSPQISCQNFGYQSFQLFIDVNNLDSKKRERIFKYCKNNPNIIFLIETLGKWNYEIIYEVKDQKEFQKQMTHIRENLGWIKSMETGIIFDHYVKYDHVCGDFK